MSERSLDPHFPFIEELVENPPPVSEEMKEAMTRYKATKTTLPNGEQAFDLPGIERKEK